MKSIELANSWAERLGKSYHARPDYRFAVPGEERLMEKRADAAIFASPVPSIQTAVVGFASIDEEEAESQLSDFAYLGAPFLIASNSDKLSLYEFSRSSVAQKHDEQSTEEGEPEEWIREHIARKVDPYQLNLSFAPSKTLLVQETQALLSRKVELLMRRARENKEINEVESFRVAMAAFGKMWLGRKNIPLKAELSDYVNEIIDEVSTDISFANIPPEAIAELYETFAVSADAKRKNGVVYTPAWLARYVIDRLPQDAFRSGCAIDPTCGSGTFLVCYLERKLKELSKRGDGVTSEDLSEAVLGVDVDPVAIEAARLSLDFFAQTVGLEVEEWGLEVADATEAEIAGDWLVGNLPFGYRTHKGKKDVSAVILENLVESGTDIKAMSLILPDSFAYKKSKGTRSARKKLGENFRIQELTRLPGEAFETSNAKTIVATARRGGPTSEVVVREVSRENLGSFKSSMYISESYVSKLPPALQDPWRLSPFSNSIERAERYGFKLEEVAEVRIGLQVYGSEADVLALKTDADSRPLLMEPKIFSTWGAKDVERLHRLTGSRDDVRRPGPWEMNESDKIIIRSTTTPSSDERLAAIVDRNSVWFTDKFIGIWVREETLCANSLAAYLQSRFARMWFSVHNPSRKHRVRTIRALPIPELRPDRWERAASLVKNNAITRPPSPSNGELPLGSSIEEWEWFNSVVETALGIEPFIGDRFQMWLSRTERM